MLKYIIIIFFIPLIIIGLSMTIILVYNPAITQSLIYGVSGTITYSASTISPDGKPVFIFVIDNLNSLIRSYKGLSSDTYKYFLVVENRVFINMFSQFEEVKIIVFGSNTPIPSYDGSITWSVASKIISFINNNKYAVLLPGSKVEISLSKIKSKYVYTALIVYVKKDTNLGGLSISYVIQRYSNILVRDAIEEELKGNYTISTVLSDLRRAIVNDIFGLNNGVAISIVSRISLSSIVFIRWGMGFIIAFALLIYDYKRNPENYELLNKIMQRFIKIRK